jgi:arsenite methyltransferase
MFGMNPVAAPVEGSISSAPAGTSALDVELSDDAATTDVLLPGACAPLNDSLFERLAWVYILFREKVFRDDTSRIARALWPDLRPAAGTQLLELGCGPGFYSCGLAARFPQIHVLGVDRSAKQLEWACRKACRLQLANCSFESDDVRQLTHGANSFHAVIAARLFTVLRNPELAISEIHRVLRPGGRCVIAEPRYAFWASLPLMAMWLIAQVFRISSECREPGRAIVLTPAEFKKLFTAQPWRRVQTWQDGRYQYALCEKA